MYKRAEIEDIIKPLAIATAGYILPAIGHYFINRSIESDLKKYPNDKVDGSKIINKAKNMAGLPDLPSKNLDFLRNAFYVPPNIIKENDIGKLKQKAYEELKSSDKRKKEDGQFMLSLIDMSTKKNGGILVGKNMDNPYVLGHELGHAIINNENSFYSTIQKYEPLITNIGLGLTAASLIPTILGYMPYTSEYEILPKLGRGMLYPGLALSATGLAGKYMYESEASSKAKDILNKIIKDRDSKEMGEKLLDKAVYSHLFGDMRKITPRISPESNLISLFTSPIIGKMLYKKDKPYGYR